MKKVCQVKMKYTNCSLQFIVNQHTVTGCELLWQAIKDHFH